jgi:hypothetical protein
MPHQQDAAARLQHLLSRHHGALLADDVGMGKTYTALAVAARYVNSCVLAPAGLVTMWRQAAERAGLATTRVLSVHSCSRRSVGLLYAGAPTLVIIDEAHLLRNAATARYRHVADAVHHCHVLLLSATPVHNREEELRALFALFRGARADALHRNTLASLIVRRDRTTRRPTPRATGAPTTPLSPSAPPPVRRHRPVVVPHDQSILDALLALPAPLPARDGAAAGALIRLSLLRAWCSSDAALHHALTQRLLRGSALRDGLHAGRHPTRSELRAWVTNGEEMQLAFPELMATQDVACGPLLPILERHLDAVRALRTLLQQRRDTTLRGDAMRVAWLRSVRQRHRDVPVVAFSQQARTVQALYRALSDIAGVGLLTGRGGRIASGPIPRRALLEQFAPMAHERPPPPEHQRITLLLATDLIAEGVNLQDAGVVIHLDLPWTFALRAQREGRCARLGSPHAQVHSYRLAPAKPLERTLRLEQRLVHKYQLGNSLVGAPLGVRASPADCAAYVQAALAAWQDRRVDGVEETRQHDASQPRWAAVCLPASRARATGRAAALVLLRYRGESELAAVWRGRVTRHARVLRALVRLVNRGEALDVRDTPADGRSIVRRALRRHTARLQLSQLAGASARNAAPAQHRALAQLAVLATAGSPTTRAALASRVATARACIAAARGAAADRALDAWVRRVRSVPREPPTALVEALCADPVLGIPRAPVAHAWQEMAPAAGPDAVVVVGGILIVAR